MELEKEDIEGVGFYKLDLKYCQPILYVFLKDKEVIYIGQSRKGLARVFNHLNEFAYTDIYIAESTAECIDIDEAFLINKYKPKYNKQYKEDYSLSLKQCMSIMSRFLGRPLKKGEMVKAMQSISIPFHVSENGSIFLNGIDMPRLAESLIKEGK